MKFLFKVEAGEEGKRIDKYLTEKCPDLTRSYIQKLVKEEGAVIGGSPVKSNYKTALGDEVIFEVPDPVEMEIAAEELPLDIVYEDKDIIIVNKQKGMVVHPAPGHYSKTLVNGLLYHCKSELSGINGVLRPGIVHRIDRDTTGLLVVCKNDNSHNSLAAQLKDHTITRCYHAIVHGVIKEDNGTIDSPIGRHPNDRKKMAVTEKNSRKAITHYRVLERFSGFTYVECRLETGRTHQIRVHMASICHPLLGDEVYGVRKSPYKLEGQTLHAKTLGFLHPGSQEYMEFDSPLPPYFIKILEDLRRKG